MCIGGVGLAAVQAPIALSTASIGLVAALATVFAMRLANFVEARIGARSELVAGVVLIALGLKMLFDHYAG